MDKNAYIDQATRGFKAEYALMDQGRKDDPEYLGIRLSNWLEDAPSDIIITDEDMTDVINSVVDSASEIITNPQKFEDFLEAAGYDGAVDFTEETGATYEEILNKPFELVEGRVIFAEETPKTSGISINTKGGAYAYKWVTYGRRGARNKKIKAASNLDALKAIFRKEFFWPEREGYDSLSDFLIEEWDVEPEDFDSWIQTFFNELDPSGGDYLASLTSPKGEEVFSMYPEEEDRAYRESRTTRLHEMATKKSAFDDWARDYSSGGSVADAYADYVKTVGQEEAMGMQFFRKSMKAANTSEASSPQPSLKTVMGNKTSQRSTPRESKEGRFDGAKIKNLVLNVFGLIDGIEPQILKEDGDSWYILLKDMTREGNQGTAIGYKSGADDYFYHNSVGDGTVWNHTVNDRAQKPNPFKLGHYSFSEDEIISMLNKFSASQQAKRAKATDKNTSPAPSPVNDIYSDEALKSLASYIESQRYVRSWDLLWKPGDRTFQMEGSTGDRGSRTDHGGGYDGDGWMDDDQVAAASSPFKNKWDPVCKEIEADLRKKGYTDARVVVDYDEKGHIDLSLYFPVKKNKLKESQVWEKLSELDKWASENGRENMTQLIESTVGEDNWLDYAENHKKEAAALLPKLQGMKDQLVKPSSIKEGTQPVDDILENGVMSETDLSLVSEDLTTESEEDENGEFHWKTGTLTFKYSMDLTEYEFTGEDLCDSAFLMEDINNAYSGTIVDVKGIKILSDTSEGLVFELEADCEWTEDDDYNANIDREMEINNL